MSLLRSSRRGGLPAFSVEHAVRGANLEYPTRKIAAALGVPDSLLVCVCGLRNDGPGWHAGVRRSTFRRWKSWRATGRAPRQNCWMCIHGKVFGSFALERRVVVPYSDFPRGSEARPLFSIEDKNFESNWRRQSCSRGGCGVPRIFTLRAEAQGASRRLRCSYRETCFSRAEKTYGRKLQEIFPHASDRAALYEVADLCAVCQPDLSGAWERTGLKQGAEYYFSKHVA